MVTNPIAKNTLGYRRWVENLYLLPEANSLMFTKTPETSAELAAALLIHYSFDLGGYSAIEMVNRWQTQYPLDWLHLAVIEALYQGRYKAISVQQILAFWHRRQQPIYHFNMEFERLICSKFPEILTALNTPALPPAKDDFAAEKVTTSVSLPITTTSAPAEVEDEYVQNQTAAPQQSYQTTEETFTPAENRRVKNILASSTLGTSSSVKPRWEQQRTFTRSLPPSNPDTQLTPTVSHPPIGQFTPETSDRSESFTEKLKAISTER